MSRGDQAKKEMAKFQKALSEMSPQRRAEIDRAFSEAGFDADPPEPLKRQMAFGGGYCFDQDGKQVELWGTFSKEDLFRIALTLRD